MTVDELIVELQKLSARGHGNKTVRYGSDCDDAGIDSVIEIDEDEYAAILHPDA